MIKRQREIATLRKLLKRHPVVGIVGTRQAGKTTLARSLIGTIGKTTAYFDLENPEDLARLSDPMLALKDLKGLVVIDELQRLPELFPVLRVLVDRQRSPSRFLILGSASPGLLRQGSETLAGRIFYHQQTNVQGGLDMPRIARMVLKGEPAVYHVVSRTALDWFVLGDVEKEYLLNLIKRLSETR